MAQPTFQIDDNKRNEIANTIRDALRILDRTISPTIRDIIEPIVPQPLPNLYGEVQTIYRTKEANKTRYAEVLSCLIDADNYYDAVVTDDVIPNILDVFLTDALHQDALFAIRALEQGAEEGRITGDLIADIIHNTDTLKRWNAPRINGKYYLIISRADLKSIEGRDLASVMRDNDLTLVVTDTDGEHPPIIAGYGAVSHLLDSASYCTAEKLIDDKTIVIARENIVVSHEVVSGTVVNLSLRRRGSIAAPVILGADLKPSKSRRAIKIKGLA